MSSAQDLSWDDAATLLDLQGALLCMRSQEGLLNPENEECVVFYLLPGQGPASSHHPALIEFLLLRNFCPQGRNCSAQGPSISCLSLSLIQMTSPYYCISLSITPSRFFMLLPVAGFPNLLWLYVHTTSSLSIHLLMDT